MSDPSGAEMRSSNDAAVAKAYARGVDGPWTADRQPGEYWRDGDRWCAITPSCDQAPEGHYVDVTTWQVTEHANGTITVAPSIFVNKGRPDAWHGFLEDGIWREV